MNRIILLLLIFSGCFLASCNDVKRGYKLGKQAKDQNEAKSRDQVYVDSLTSKEFLLKNWKVTSGDAASYGSVNYDDSSWDSIVLGTSFSKKLRSYFDKDGYAWLRTKVYVGNPKPTPAIFTLSQIGASELYLNGEMIRKWGDMTSKKVKAYNPTFEPIMVSLEGDSTHTIAIKLALPKNHFSLNGGISKRPIMELTVSNKDNYDFVAPLSPWNSRIFWTLIKLGVFLILSIIHFYFYRSQKSKKSNLYFFLFAFSLFLSEALFMYFRSYVENVGWYATRDILNLILVSTLSNIFFLTAIYKEFNTKYGPWYYIVFSGFVGISVVGIFMQNIPLDFLKFIVNIAFVILTIVVTTKALGKKNPRASIILVGLYSPFILILIAFLSIIFYPIVTGDYSFMYDRNPNESMSIKTGMFMGIFLMTGKDLLTAICLSLYISLEYTQVNKDLEKKLEDINDLSREKEYILESQKETLEKEVLNRTTELKNTIEQLKTTQDQLVQKEKLASLGELTAGIAHEIQNPLNFVNNFSELSIELIDELEENTDPEIEKELLGDLAENQKKINFHGKRASSIVKGMLSHSRSSSGEKTETNINDLADEYIRLSFHGMRAKDKSFNSDYKLHLEPGLPLLHVAQQEIGRVLLNLLNNSFYSVYKKTQSGIPDYRPLVEISTGLVGQQVYIKVRDNGLGIPNELKNKIFQPFFTTKPTGEGTGLGLSLSYDIITKGHAGSMEIESQKDEYCEIIIKLPIL